MSELSKERDQSDSTLAIIIPLFNDWTSLRQLLRSLDSILLQHEIDTTVIVINDGSNLPIPASLRNQKYDSIDRVRVVNLRRNLGHQRAIAVGMFYIWNELKCDQVIVMDADGEDRPEDVPRLIESARNNPGTFIFSERTSRSEGLVFRICYSIFTRLFQFLTGKRLYGGNFSAFPYSMLPSLLTVSEIWNHYSAAIIKAKFSISCLKSSRGQRFDGRSEMSFSGLVIHGLSAISVFSEIVGVRLLLFCMFPALIATLGIGTTVWIRLFTDMAVPGWATYTTGLLAVILLQTILMSLIFSFIVLNSRNASSFIPMRDASQFIGSTDDLYSR